MRLGGPVFAAYADPAAWAREVAALGYRAAYCPVEPSADDETVRAYAREAARADIVIAEVGAWSNPMSPDAKARAEALEKCKASLLLAERIGARCAVNIVGSRGAKWDGPDARDLTEETFAMIVEITRDIIDSVKPTRTFYTLETMPWMYPDSADSYLRLFKAVDRKGFAAHFDPVNLVCSPQRYFGNAGLMREFFSKLGPHIRSCHAKDVLLGTGLTTHLDEVRLGTGGLDCRVFLAEAARLDAGMPVMLEHLSAEQDYRLAAEHLRGAARQEGLSL
jgi:sugar phosphate isomerase/epimerase